MLMVAALCGPLRADIVRTQVITLQQGWNSVLLQVTPSPKDPSLVFSNTPVTMCAMFSGIAPTAQYIQNPPAIQWKRDGWLVWYSPTRPDSFLSTLQALNANKSYLIYSQQAYTWTVQGTVNYALTKWKPNAFNYVGFGVDPQSPPTFGQYFAPSTNHQPYQIYRLNNGQWAQVANPVGTPMQAGEAFWIYCNGSSTYQGPLTVKLDSGQQVSFSSSGQTGMLLGNQTTEPMNVKVQTVANDIGIPLSYVMRGITPGAMVNSTYNLPATYQVPTLTPSQQYGFWLALRREQMVNPTQSALLEITTDTGVQIWVPVQGQNTITQ